jgi:hypothetical protein
MATACKDRLVREALRTSAGHTKKRVYQDILKEYPLIVSDKYARAAATHAAGALAALNARPRRTGLALGAVLAGGLFALYWLALPELRARAPQPLLADIGVLCAGWGVAVLAVRLMVARGLQKILPPDMMAGGKAPVSAGVYAVYAGIIAAALWAGGAFAAKAEWLMALLHRLP